MKKKTKKNKRRRKKKKHSAYIVARLALGAQRTVAR